MDHIFFFLFLIVFTLGISLLVIVGLLFFQHKKILISYYFYLLLTLAIISFIEIIDFFYYILPDQTETDIPVLNNIFLIIYYLLYSAIVHIITLITYKLIRKPKKIIKIIILLFFNVLYPLIIIYLCLKKLELLRQFSDTVLYISVIYFVILLNCNLNKIDLPILRKFVKTLLLLHLVFTPIFIFQTYITYFIVKLPAWIYKIPHFYMLYYILLNIINLIYAAKFFIKPVFSEYFSIPDKFITAFAITSREREIIKLMLKGESNKEIAFTLSIAENTVKNHIYNIFKKTGVKNRIEFIMQIQKHATLS